MIVVLENVSSTLYWTCKIVNYDEMSIILLIFSIQVGILTYNILSKDTTIPFVEIIIRFSIILTICVTLTSFELKLGSFYAPRLGHFHLYSWKYHRFSSHASYCHLHYQLGNLSCLCSKHIQILASRLLTQYQGK